MPRLLSRGTRDFTPRNDTCLAMSSRNWGTTLQGLLGPCRFFVLILMSAWLCCALPRDGTSVNEEERRKQRKYRSAAFKT